jgi:hypothetical protein
VKPQIALLFILGAMVMLISCEYFDSEIRQQREVDRQLAELHNAIESLLPPEADTAAAGDSAGEEADTVASTSEDSSAGPSTASDDHSVSGEDAHATGENQPREQIAVAVVAIVDSYEFQATAEEDEAATATASQAAQRRERVTRNELVSLFVKNSDIASIPPDKDSQEAARAEIIATSSVELSRELAQQIASALKCEVLVCGMVEKDGAEVTLVAQLGSDGSNIYQDTINNWPAVVNAPVEQQTEE